MDHEQVLVDAIKEGIREGVKNKFSTYGGPIDKLLKEVVEQHDAPIRSMLFAAIESAIGNENFREEIAAAVRHKLATILISRFGGELEKHVNILKSDPATRARITLAIENIVKERSAATT